MDKCLLSLLLVVCMVHSRAQNLLSNNSFEDRNTCTELRAICAPEGWFRIPLDAVSNTKGTAGFFLGTHHENLVMENVQHPGIFRTYLYTRILCPLEKGREYIFSASFRTPGEQPFAHMNLLWTDFEPFRFQDRISREKQRFTITSQNKKADQPYGWKEYSISFVATGEEKYLMIGNLDKEIFPGKPKQRSLIIYEMDNVSLYPADATVRACEERDANLVALYQHNYRHTPGQFIDDEPVAQTTPPVITPPSVPKPEPVIIETPPAPVANDTLVVPDVLFKFDKSELNPAFAYRLDTLIDKIKNRTFKRIEILGHTDSLGNNNYNQKLSISRAETVKQYLSERLHYPSDIITTKGFAALLPVSTNTTAVGRQKNRRVEIVLIRN